MSLSRSPSPGPGGGWASPGLNINTSGRSSPARPNGAAASWESTSRLKNGAAGTGYPSFSTQNQGFFTRHMRKLSNNLPRFNSYGDKEKLGRGRWSAQAVPVVGRLRAILARMGRKLKIRLLVGSLMLLCIYIVYNICKRPSPAGIVRESGRRNPGTDRRRPTAAVHHWRRTAWLGGGEKFVIILAANVGGGVMEWKGAREWAIERDSTRNKNKYVQAWGYDLEVVDMSTKKRYAHEWRESWEKVDFVRHCMRKYPKAEWCVCPLCPLSLPQDLAGSRVRIR